MEKQLLTLYADFAGNWPDEVVRIAGAGSNRRYYRLKGNPTVIGTVGTIREENEAFIYLCHDFHDKGLPVPELLAVSGDKMSYLQSDLGDISLFKLITKAQDSGFQDENLVKLLEKTITRLPEFQWMGAQGLDFSKCYPVAEMGRRAIMWDLNYFKYCFLKATGIEFREDLLEDDFLRLSDIILSEDTGTFMFRDFQSRNVMIKDNDPFFIDFQGGRRGPWQYDLVSFLWQAKARIPEYLKSHLTDCYLSSAARFSKIDRNRFHTTLPYFVLFRTLQVLGAYGFRGYVERKPHFIQSIPPAIENLSQLFSKDSIKLPYLSEILKKMVELDRFKEPGKDGPLKVKVASFGYNRHGIPSDESGNGGGFVFDCRALHNPGRYTEYKSLTGLDQKVIDFLEKEGSILNFLENVYSIVDNSVKTYSDRGFNSLMISFGCTGGQHRSVYSAEHVAEHLHRKFPGIEVILTHFELDKHRILK